MNGEIVKQGYKHTEVGVIPEEWSIHRLENILARLKNGAVYTATKNGGIPISRIETISSGKIDFEKVGFAEHSRQLEQYRLQPKDILFSHINSLDHIGKVAIYDGAELLYHGMNLLLLRVAEGVVPNFLFHWFDSPIGRQRTAVLAKQAVSQASISTSDLRGLPIPLPTKQEQSHIADAIDGADYLISKLDQLIAKKRDIKQAAMQQLLTGQTRLPGYSGRWEFYWLRDLLTMKATYGIVTTGDFKSTGVPMVRGGDIKNGKIDRDLPYVSPQKSAEYSRTVLRRNDVVIALVGYPGEAAKVTPRLDGANISRAVGLLRGNKVVDPDYLVSFLNSPVGRRLVLAPSAGSAQLVVNLADLNKLKLPLPPLPEQTAIATLFSDMDAEIFALENRRNKTLEVKQGMMQELLAGRIRLI